MPWQVQSFGPYPREIEDVAATGRVREQATHTLLVFKRGDDFDIAMFRVAASRPPLTMHLLNCYS
jgi:hypothetical protein